MSMEPITLFNYQVKIKFHIHEYLACNHQISYHWYIKILIAFYSAFFQIISLYSVYQWHLFLQHITYLYIWSSIITFPVSVKTTGTKLKLNPRPWA